MTTTTPTTELTGGCQCGAVRFRAATLGRSSICHCRMCQKAFGGFFGPLVTGFGVVWTRGEPKWFRSSNQAERGFCGDCGTPLAYHTDGDDKSVELAIGAFDNPGLAAPVLQVNPRDRLDFFAELTSLPTRPYGAEPRIDTFIDGVVSYQHPDHDTAQWPEVSHG
ncbi:MAG: GFA family protein [Devosia sp.]